MKKLAIYTTALALCGGILFAAIAAETAAPESSAAPAAPAKEVVCFESRKGASEVTQKEIQPGLPNVKCSPKTGAVLWWGDPFDGTVAMNRMPLLEEISLGNAVVKPRADYLTILPMCGTACHNGVGPEFSPPTLPTDKKPKPLPVMEGLLPDAKDLQHGHGRIWCLDCHHTTERNKLVDNFGDPVSIEEPQLLCGKCHGDKMRDWRDGIHGKRIGQWASNGKKRWFTCTECHNPHNVQDGTRNRGFIQIEPESSPQLPYGMPDAKYETTHPIAHH